MDKKYQGKGRSASASQSPAEQSFMKGFIDRWQKNPLYSTGAVLIIMIVIQTLALGFNYPSAGAWFASWTKNWINILRNNAPVGIVALGMTFVIISGGIDLAVGSTLVAVGAVMMVLINGNPNGILTAAGITGAPAFVIGILAAMAMGCLIGYIKLLSDISDTNSRIVSLESQLAEMKSSNNEIYNEIVGNIDLEQIRRIAIDEFGMQYADQDQIVVYSDTKGDTVHQVVDIER